MMCKQIAIFFFFLFCIHNIIAQTTLIKTDSAVKRNSIFIEAAGRCGFISLNYERILFNKNTTNLAFDFGVGPYLPIGGFVGGFQIPLSVNYFFGKNDIKFVTGLGIVNHIDPTPEPSTFNERKIFIQTGHMPSPPLRIVINPILGLRLDKKKSRIFVSILFTPSIINNPCHKYRNGRWNSGFELFPWGGLNIGFKFN